MVSNTARTFPWDRGHVEDWTLALQRHFRQVEPLQPADLAILYGWLHDAVPGACSFNRFEIGASCNHDLEILGAACCSPDRALAETARDGMILGLRCMLGEVEPKDVGLPPQVRNFGGSEQLSSDYEPMRLRAVAGLRLGWRDHAEAQRVSGLYFASMAALFALSAAPGPDRVAHAASKGRLFYGGPALPPVGGRGNHFGQCENEPAFCLLAGIKAEWAENRYTDALPFLRQLGGDFGLSENLRLGISILMRPTDPESRASVLGSVSFAGHWARDIIGAIRFQERQHFSRWADGSVACWVEKQPTNLSPSYMAWVFHAGANHAEVAFPFQAGAKNRGKDQNYPLATCAETDGYLVVQGGNALCSPVKLPEGEPLYHVVVGPDGPPVLVRTQSEPSVQQPPAATPAPPSKKRKEGFWDWQ